MTDTNDQCKHITDKCSWKRIEYLQNDAYRRKQNEQDTEHPDDGKPCQDSDQLCRVLLTFKLSTILDILTDENSQNASWAVKQNFSVKRRV